MIEVLSAGYHASIQDLGRVGARSFGVPISGVMDNFSAKMANQILNNSAEDSVLEITLGKVTLKFNNQTYICISGADFSATLNGKLIPLNARIKIDKGAVLKFNKPVFGARSYLAVKGGFQTDVILKSRSFYPGISQTSTIKKEMLLPIKELVSEPSESKVSVRVNSDHFTANYIETYPGPEFDLLNANQKKWLFSTELTIGKDNSRMGYRLEEPLTHNLDTMLTSAVQPGTVQLTPSGKLIILMRDCQVTGGYPRVLQLTDMAINRLAQKNTGNKLIFKLIILTNDLLT